MAQTGSVRIWWDVDVGAYRMITPFNKAFVDTFKVILPASERAYDVDSKVWTFWEKHLTNVEALVTKLWGNAPVVITRSQAERASQSTGISNQSIPIDSVIASFVKLIPYEAMQQAYKRAAMLLHPDRGGDMEQMSKMNAAWQRLEKELYKK